MTAYCKRKHTQTNGSMHDKYSGKNERIKKTQWGEFLGWVWRPSWMTHYFPIRKVLLDFFEVYPAKTKIVHHSHNLNRFAIVERLVWYTFFFLFLIKLADIVDCWWWCMHHISLLQSNPTVIVPMQGGHKIIKKKQNARYIVRFNWYCNLSRFSHQFFSYFFYVFILCCCCCCSSSHLFFVYWGDW